MLRLTRWLYGRTLLCLPREHYARVGESMRQTYDDLMAHRAVGKASLAFGLYVDLLWHVFKDNLIKSNLIYLGAAVVAILCGYLARALNLQVPGSVYLLWGAVAFALGAAQTELRTAAISAALFGLLLSLSFLLPAFGSASDWRGYLALTLFSSLFAIVAGLLAAGAGFWARRRILVS